MNLEFAFLCDAATEHGGKLNALGIGIERLTTAAVPVVHKRIMLVARISFGPDDTGDHPFTIRISDADGRSVGRTVEGNINFRLTEGAMAAKANLLVDLVRLEFTAYGPHEAIVMLDGRELVNLPLEIARSG